MREIGQQSSVAPKSKLATPPKKEAGPPAIYQDLLEFTGLDVDPFDKELEAFQSLLQRVKSYDQDTYDEDDREGQVDVTSGKEHVSLSFNDVRNQFELKREVAADNKYSEPRKIQYTIKPDTLVRWDSSIPDDRGRVVELDFETRTLFDLQKHDYLTAKQFREKQAKSKSKRS